MEDIQQRVLTEIHEDELVAMTVDLVNFPSPPGEEAAIGDYLARRLAELGMRVHLQEVEPGRNNVVGRLPGKKGGPTLLFSAHFDTSTTGREIEAWGGGYSSAGFGGGQARATLRLLECMRSPLRSCAAQSQTRWTEQPEPRNRRRPHRR